MGAITKYFRCPACSKAVVFTELPGECLIVNCPYRGMKEKVYFLEDISTKDGKELTESESTKTDIKKLVGPAGYKFFPLREI